MTKKDKVCLEDSQVKRLAHDAFMMGKGEKEGICDTVVDIVHESTTTDERIGKFKKNSKKKKKGEYDSIDAAKDVVSTYKKAKHFWDGLI